MIELGDGCLQGWMVAMKAGFVSLRCYFQTCGDRQIMGKVVLAKIDPVKHYYV